jgi:hypothetical protein
MLVFKSVTYIAFVLNVHFERRQLEEMVFLGAERPIYEQQMTSVGCDDHRYFKNKEIIHI